MLRFAIGATLLLAITACAVMDYRRPYYDGPVSDHFDGQRFFNPEMSIGKGALDVIAWRLKADTAEWPDSVPLKQRARPAPRVEGDALEVIFVGHATVLIQTAGLNILTDPTWAERASLVSFAGPKRVTPPGIAFEDLPPIDLVVVSHNHYDHMDLPTLKKLHEAHRPLFVLPLGNDVFLRDLGGDARVQTLDWWQSIPVGSEVRVHAVPVYHWSRRGPFDRNKALWSGYVLETPGGNLYFAGDTGLGNGAYFRETARRFGAFRLALLPVGAYEPRWFMRDQHVNPAEAVEIHKLLNARTTLGVHLRTFQLTDEAIDQPERELQEALAARHISSREFFTLPAGGSWSDAVTPPRLAGATRPSTGPARSGCAA